MYRKAARFLSKHGVTDFEPERIRFISAPRINNIHLETAMYHAIKKAVENKGLIRL